MQLSQRELEEIELSISFGQRLMQYCDSTIQKILSSMIDDNSKIRQYYEADRMYITDIIQSLERGDGIAHLMPIKKRLTIVGQQFFKKEFSELKTLCNSI